MLFFRFLELSGLRYIPKIYVPSVRVSIDTTSASVVIVIFTLISMTVLLSLSPQTAQSKFSLSPSSGNQARNTVEHNAFHEGTSSSEGNTIDPSSTHPQSDTASAGGCINYNPSSRKITVSCNPTRLTDIDNRIHDIQQLYFL